MFWLGRHIAAMAVLLFAWAGSVAAKECKCRYFDQRVEIGATACINGKLAQCLMFQNNPSWKFISDSCPLSQKGKPIERPAKLVAR